MALQPLFIRGWKQLSAYIQTFAEYAVAPYVGAWIETEKVTSDILFLSVAPYVGAWIETDIQRQVAHG